MRAIQAKNEGNSHVYRRKVNPKMLEKKQIAIVVTRIIRFSFLEYKSLSKTISLLNVRAIHATMMLLWLGPM